jgi:DNA polymerase-3 subunit delta'
VLVLTSSEPGALLPTIRSRVVTVRVPPVAPADVVALLEREEVRTVLAADGVREPAAALAERVGGAPGMLFGGTATAAATSAAQRILSAVLQGGRPERLKVAFVQGAAGARGAYSDVLDALTVALRDMARDAAATNERRALGAARAVDAVERAKVRAAGNVSPQLLTAELVRVLAAELG